MIWAIGAITALTVLWVGAAYGLMLHQARGGFTYGWWVHWLDHRPPFCVELSYKRIQGIRVKEPHNRRPGMYRLGGRWLAMVCPVANKPAWYIAPVGWKATLARCERNFIVHISIALQATAEWLGALTGRRTLI